MSGFLGEKVQSVNALCPGFVVLQMAAVQATHEHWQILQRNVR